MYTDLDRVSPCSCTSLPQFPNPPHGCLSRSTLLLGPFNEEMIKMKQTLFACSFFLCTCVNFISKDIMCEFINMSEGIFHCVDISMCAHVNSTAHINQCDNVMTCRVKVIVQRLYGAGLHWITITMNSFSSLQTTAQTGLQNPVKKNNNQGLYCRPCQWTNTHFGIVCLS